MMGMEMMLKNMLEGMGIDIEKLTREGMEAYKQFQGMAAHMLKTQSDIVGLLRVNYELQKNNSDKINAIMAHLDIEFSPSTITGAEELNDGRNGQPELIGHDKH